MLAIKRFIVPEIKELIHQGNLQGLRKFLTQFHPIDILDSFEELSDIEKAIIFRVLPKEYAAEILSEMDPDEVEKLVKKLTDDEVIEIFESMDPDDRAELLDELPAEIARKILSSLSPEERRKTIILLNYPEDSCGRIMTPEFVEVQRGTTCGNALKKLIREAKHLPDEVLYQVYVVDDKKHLNGILELIDLIKSDKDTPVDDVMIFPHFVYAHDDQEEAARIIKEYNLIALPVVDSENKLLGVITIDDIVDIIEEEATEDMYKFAGVVDPEDQYFRLSQMEKLAKRLPTIIAMLILGNISGMILNYFQNELAKLIVLSFFIPNLMNTTGVMGAQSATFAIRAIATGEFELNLKAFLKYFMKELTTSLLIAIIVGLGMSIIAYLREPSFLPLAFVVSSAIMISAIVANMVGFTLPFLVKKLGWDPASISAPLITTLGDVITLTSYFLMAKIILHL